MIVSGGMSAGRDHCRDVVRRVEKELRGITEVECGLVFKET